ncbi:MAG: elongation factor Ts [Bacteroidetes bacterium]|nr:elongation factor Ts [Bacteroidota bacterium]MCW5897182.1 elongation factor Ts [Bacteroidota bacterium]
MEITSEMIKNLREKTGAGMMDCKRALEASSGDMNAAIEYLRKKGAASGAKRADRAAKEGMIVTRIAANGKSGVIVEVNCETDFVARSDDFATFANTIAQAVEAHRPASVEALMNVTMNGKKVSELYNDLLAKVGEKIEIRRFSVVDSPDGVVSAYTHLGNKIGVLVEMTGIGTDAAATGAGRDVAMQVAAMNPLVISRDQVEKSLIERELDIYKTQAANEGKPAQIVEKIALGRLEKYYQEVALMEQTFIKDSGKTIKDFLAEAGKLSGQPISIKRFQRFHLGEETK